MVGGLVAIAAYGSQDLYLTANPSITFFKTVYRRHTNFSMESIIINFDDIVRFNGKGTATIPIAGHLINKTYLQLTVPRIDLMRQCQDVFDDKNTIKDDLVVIETFLKFNREAYVCAKEICCAKNIKTSKKIIDIIKEIFDKCSVDIINRFKVLVPVTGYSYEQVSLEAIGSNIDPDTACETLISVFDNAIDKCNHLFRYYYDISVKYVNKSIDAMDCKLKFAWIKRLGHALVDEIEVRIGASKIDRHYGTWLDIWYELTANRNLEHLYYEMIGNVKALTDFNRDTKPEYTLQIPLQFWFCRFSGSSLPLCCLENYDVTIHLKTKKLQDVAYIDKDECIMIKGACEGLTLEEYAEKMNYDLKAKLMIDFIYLDREELRRFATSSNEYLIDQLQREQFFDVTATKTTLSFESFVNPTKEFIFTAQSDDRPLNYGINDNGTGNPIKNASIIFETYTRVIEMDGGYFNYVQPREKHTSTPKDGINVYSFALHPEELQPTGSANLSRIRRLGLELDFVTKNHKYTVTGYTRSMNILRFIGGMAGLAFTWG